MAKVSVLIPARNERFLGKTVADVLAKATGDIEVIAVLDGYWPDPPLPNDPRLIQCHLGIDHGMRDGIAAAAAIARGQYLLKLDAHCMVAPGFDETLQQDIEDNWIVVPRRYSLKPEEWEVDHQRPTVDYHYLCFPYRENHDVGLHGETWPERFRTRKDIEIDDEMSSQGSCWFMSRRHWDWMGGMPWEGYGRFVQEFQQIGMKTWLGGGRCVVNKKCWYAHLHKGKTYGRGYYISKPEMIMGTAWSAWYWCYDQWPGRVHDLAWLIEKFWPVPTWPENWPEILAAKRPEPPPIARVQER
jgi:hypothetical protein